MPSLDAALAKTKRPADHPRIRRSYRQRYPIRTQGRRSVGVSNRPAPLHPPIIKNPPRTAGSVRICGEWRLYAISARGCQSGYCRVSIGRRRQRTLQPQRKMAAPAFFAGCQTPLRLSTVASNDSRAPGRRKDVDRERKHRVSDRQSASHGCRSVGRPGDPCRRQARHRGYSGERTEDPCRDRDDDRVES